MKTYKLNVGRHHGLNENDEEQDWEQGQIVTTNQDLSKLGDKFTLLSDDEVSPEPEKAE